MAAQAPKALKIVVAGCGIIGASTTYHLVKQAIKLAQPLAITVLDQSQIGMGNTRESAGLVLTKHKKNPILEEFANQTLEDAKEINTFFIQSGSDLSPYDAIIDPYTAVFDYLKAAERLVKYQYKASPIPPVSLTINQHKKFYADTPITDPYTRVIDVRGVHTPSPYRTMLRSHYFVLTPPYLVCPNTPPNKQANIRPHYPKLSIPPIQISRNFYIKHMASSIEIGVYEDEKEQVYYTDPDESVHKRPIPYESLEAVLPKLLNYVPYINDFQLRSYHVGKTTYTPDGQPIISYDGQTVKFTGCNGYGVSWAGGIGRLLATTALNNTIPAKFRSLEESRFGFDNTLTSEEVRSLSITHRSSKFHPT